MHRSLHSHERHACSVVHAAVTAVLCCAVVLWFLQVPSENMDHLPEPAIELWHKVVPLGLIFFCASFNLTILQVGVLTQV